MFLDIMFGSPDQQDSDVYSALMRNRITTHGGIPSYSKTIVGHPSVFCWNIYLTRYSILYCIRAPFAYVLHTLFAPRKIYLVRSIYNLTLIICLVLYYLPFCPSSLPFVAQPRGDMQRVILLPSPCYDAFLHFHLEKSSVYILHLSASFELCVHTKYFVF